MVPLPGILRSLLNHAKSAKLTDIYSPRTSLDRSGKFPFDIPFDIPLRKITSAETFFLSRDPVLFFWISRLDGIVSAIRYKNDRRGSERFLA